MAAASSSSAAFTAAPAPTLEIKLDRSLPTGDDVPDTPRRASAAAVDQTSPSKTSFYDIFRSKAEEDRRKWRKEAGGGGHNMPKIVPWHLCGIVITLAMAAAPRLARQSHSTSIGHKVWCQTSQMGMIATIIIAHPAMIKRLRLGGHCPPPAHGSFRWPTGKKDICLAI